MIILFSESLSILSPPYSGGITILLCGSLTDTCNKILELTVFLIDRQCIILDNHLILGTAQPENVVESNFEDIFLPVR